MSRKAGHIKRTFSSSHYVITVLRKEELPPLQYELSRYVAGHLICCVMCISPNRLNSFVSCSRPKPAPHTDLNNVVDLF